MSDESGTFYIIKYDILPEVLKKTIKAKEFMKTGKADTVHSAVTQAGLSRSAFYKYKDSIFPFFEASRGKIVTLGMILEDQPGVLSRILDTIARARGNILTINQNIPIQGTANVTISIRTAGMEKDVEALLNEVSDITGVKKIDILASE